MRKILTPLAVGLLSLLAVASHAAPPGLSATPEDLRNLRSPSSAPRDASTTARDSEFSKQFQKALAGEEKARQAAREQQLERNSMPRLEQRNDPSRRFGPPDTKKDSNMGIYFDEHGSAATSCREDGIGKTKCSVRELR